MTRQLTDDEIVERLLTANIRPDDDSVDVWAAYLEQRFAFPFCSRCDYWIYLPRSLCPNCWSTELELRELSGRGSVYTFTVDRNVAELQVMGLIELADQPGLRIVTPVIECSADDVAIDMDVTLQWLDFRGIPVPAFAPVQAGVRNDS
jgi:uncharacterized OB-fold protein